MTTSFTELHRVRLPDIPGPRKNSRPKQRHGWTVTEPFALPGRVLVLKDGADWPLWVPEGLVSITET